MLESLITYVDAGVEIARVWGPLIVFLLMTVESSFIPFPSEIIMIPAGVMIARGEFPGSGSIALGLAIAIFCGLAGSLAGAYINYYLSLWLGRPFLHRYGKYFFLKPRQLDRAEELFRQYGEVSTFACRLIPAIRQLISIPAGLSRMNIFRFSLFTGLGAGLWVATLALMGYFWGRSPMFANNTYGEAIHYGKDQIHDNLLWILFGLAVFVVFYLWLHKKVMGSPPALPNDQVPPDAP
jgi:membrane protein DedA with SNARE-associated domain